MSRRYSEPIRNHKLTEHRRHTANHPVFFKKRKTSTQKRIQVIYKDAQDSPETTLKKRNLQNKRNRTIHISISNVTVLLFAFYFILFFSQIK